MYSYAVLALAALAQANPVLLARQRVTARISPSASPPPSCTGSVNYSFGIVANNVTSSVVAKRQATQIGDGQFQAANASPSVSQITDGQVQAATGTAEAFSQITELVSYSSRLSPMLIASSVVKSKSHHLPLRL